jgi:hypothetical protein
MNELPNFEIMFSSNPANWQKAYRYLRRASQPAADPSYVPFIINTTGTYPYQDMRDVPFTVWDVDATPERQLNAGFFENNEAPPAGNLNGIWRATNANNGGWEFVLVFFFFFSPTPQAQYQIDIYGDNYADPPQPPKTDLMYWWVARDINSAARPWPNDAGANVTATLKIKPYKPNGGKTQFTFTAPNPPSYTDSTAKANVKDITVFPNPYYGNQVFEKNKFNKFVTFSRLPKKATIKIYSLAGEFIRAIEKNDDTQFIIWDLKNHNKLAVASGMYIAHIDMPELGEQKILKLAIIMENQLLDRI